jgi:hypothetical protein
MAILSILMVIILLSQQFSLKIGSLFGGQWPESGDQPA